MHADAVTADACRLAAATPRSDAAHQLARLLARERVRNAQLERDLAASNADRARLSTELARLRGDLSKPLPPPPEPPKAAPRTTVGMWIIDLLREHGPLTSDEIVKRTGRTLNTVWTAASLQARWINRTRDGRHIRYGLRPDAPT